MVDPLSDLCTIHVFTRRPSTDTRTLSQLQIDRITQSFRGNEILFFDFARNHADQYIGLGLTLTQLLDSDVDMS